MNLYEPGVYALLPPGWYRYKCDGEFRLTMRRSEFNEEFHRNMCKQWSEKLEHWEDLASYYCSWDVPSDSSPSIEKAAANHLLLSQCMRTIFDEPVFSQYFLKPWMGDEWDIDEKNAHLAELNQPNPYEYQSLIKLPDGFDVSSIDYFCDIFEMN